MATLGVRKRNEENVPEKKRCLNVKHFFRQQEAFVYADKMNGVVFARDRKKENGIAKQYYVAEDRKTMYDYVMSHPEDERDFYEIIREGFPAKLVVDLDLTPEKLCDGEDLHETMNNIQEEVVKVCIEQLAHLDRNLEDDDVLVLNSDGSEKASRHLIFPAWFKEIRPSMHAFAMSKILPALTDSAKRAFDDRIYTKNRPMRFMECTKRGSKRRLRLADSPDIFTEAHRAVFRRSLVQLPPPEGYELIEPNPEKLQLKPETHKCVRKRIAKRPSSSEVDCMLQHLKEQVPEIKDCHDPRIDKNHYDEHFGSSVLSLQS